MRESLCVNVLLLTARGVFKEWNSRQIIWLFGLSDSPHPGFSIREELETEQDRIEFVSRVILESIGIIVEETEVPEFNDFKIIR